MNRPTAIVAAGILLVVVTGCAQSTIPPGASTLPGAGSPQSSDEPVVPSASIGMSSPSAAPPVVWTVAAAAPMLRARDGFRVVTLGDGSLLVVGDDQVCMPGPASPGSETAERYDPVADAWTTVVSLNKPRKDFAMVPTPDGGAMVIGGINADDQPFSSTKRLDLGAADWVDGPLLKRAYGDPSAVTAADGRVYVVGPTSFDETTSTSTIEILAPDRTSWTDGGRIEGVSVSAVVRLDDGRLVVLGSTFESPHQLYVHDSGGAEGWRQLAPSGFDIIEQIVASPNGGVLVFGWSYDLGTDGTTPLMVRRHDPATDRWVETGQMKTGRFDPQVATLADGRVLVAGGLVGRRNRPNESEIARSSEIFDPRTDAWTTGPDLLGVRRGGQALALRDGSVLVIGGVNVLNTEGDTPFCPGALSSVERLMPAP